MPSYSYKCPNCGISRVVIKPMSKSGTRVKCKCKATMNRNFQADFGKQYVGDIWPYPSAALGVHPEEVQHRMEFDRQMGVPTEYNSDGDPIMRNATHRRKFCRAHKVHDRNAGYSDPVPD